MMLLMLTLADCCQRLGGRMDQRCPAASTAAAGEEPLILSIAAGIGWSALGLQMPLPSRGRWFTLAVAPRRWP